MNAIHIRPAQYGDIPAMIELLRLLFSIEADFDFDELRQRRSLTLMLEQPDLRPIWVATHDGVAIGMCSVQVLVSTAEGGWVGLLEDMIIQPEFRGHGVGSELFSTACRWADETGLTRIQLLCDSANMPALQFYENQGCSRTQLVCIRRKS